MTRITVLEPLNADADGRADALVRPVKPVEAVQVCPSADPYVEAQRRAFLKLFPDAKDTTKALPVAGHPVFVLDVHSSKHVHLATYSEDHKNFESDGGWFERIEVELWAYVPSLEHEKLRTISPEA